MLQYEKKINKIAGHRAFFMADANQYIACLLYTSYDVFEESNKILPSRWNTWGQPRLR